MLAAEIPPLDISREAYAVDKLDQFRTCFSVFNKNVKSEDVIAEAKERPSPVRRSPHLLRRQKHKVPTLTSMWGYQTLLKKLLRTRVAGMAPFRNQGVPV